MTLRYANEHCALDFVSVHCFFECKVKLQKDIQLLSTIFNAKKLFRASPNAHRLILACRYGQSAIVGEGNEPNLIAVALKGA